MPPNFVSLDPAGLDQGQVYDLLVSAVQPRPIAFVSTIDGEGRPNLAPYSFFTAGGVNPPSVVFCPVSGPDGNPKGTLSNVRTTREFVVNVLLREQASGMNETSFPYSEGVDEWAIAGFTALPSEVVGPPRVAESPVHLECRAYQIVSHGEGPGSGNYVIGEVLRAHVRTSLWEGQRIGAGSLRPIGRLGATEYVDLAVPEIFEMSRPSNPGISSENR